MRPDTRQPPARAGLVGGVSQSVSPGPDGMINYSYSYVGWHEAWRGWSHPLRSPGPRQGQLCDIISLALQRKTPRKIRSRNWIPGYQRAFALPRGKWTPGGEADHLRIPDLIQICRVCKGRGLPSTGIRWCQKWDVHRHGVLGQGAFRGVLLGSGNSRDSPWPLGGLRVILVTSEKQ